MGLVSFKVNIASEGHYASSGMTLQLIFTFEKQQEPERIWPSQSPVNVSEHAKLRSELVTGFCHYMQRF